ncbi:MAG: AI-2E family transporter [Candidatus Kapaibacterium sp.]|nr:MAG: AI-2E family transporter [Candidatus Kapabacteria bacterium]
MRGTTTVLGGIAIAAVLIAVFFHSAGLLAGPLTPLLLYGSAMVFLVPLRAQVPLARRLSNWATLLFALWIVADLGTVLLPFALAFFIAYVLDPLVTRAERWGIRRWVSALVVNAMLIGITTVIAIFLAPVVWSQLQELVKSISSLVTASQQFLESRQFYRWLRSLGIPSDQIRSLVQDYLMPRLENLSQYLFSLVLVFLEGAAGVIAQVVNIILVPLLAFYLLMDMPRLKTLIVQLLSRRSPRLLRDIVEINRIIRAYITGQLITATFVGVLGIGGFVAAGIPYGVFLGVICGLLNPIPYVGLLASLLIAIVAIILAESPHPILDIVLVTIIINLLHFIGTYVIDPRVTGKRVGLHPVLLIVSLFVFGHFFGLLGLIGAVPVTAVLMMYFNRWVSSLEQQIVEQPVSDDAA